MSNIIKQKIESRQKLTKKSSITKTNNFASLYTLNSINKESEKPCKKIIKDLSLNLKNYTIPCQPNKTCMNHTHKKIIINEISNPSHNKKIFHNLIKAKFKKYPLKLNYKPSKSLKDLLEDEKLLNLNLRPNHTRKNTNTKIELFSTNSTLSFLNINIKDSNKELAKPVKIKEINDKSKNKNNNKKKFSATFIENKIRQYIKFNSSIKNKECGKYEYDISPNKSNKINNIKKNKTIDCFLSYKKNVNKKRNISYLIHDNSNTNSLNDPYNINRKNTNSTNLLLDNISFSLNKNKIRNKTKNKLIKKRTNSQYNKTCSINNKKLNLCSLPNLLCNNYIFNYDDRIKDHTKKYKNRNSYQSLLDHKKSKKNCNKIKIIDNKKIKKLFKNFKTFNRDKKNNKTIKNSKSEEKICLNKNKPDKVDNIKIKLDKIETNVKSLLNGFYSIYLYSIQNNFNHKSNMNYDYDLII